MLSLTGRPGESIQIGDTITITVLSVKDNQLRIGIGAPDDVYDRINQDLQTVPDKRPGVRRDSKPIGGLSGGLRR